MTAKIDVDVKLEKETEEAKSLIVSMTEAGLDEPKSEYDEVLGFAHEKLRQLENAKEFRTRPSKDAYDKAVKPFNEAIRFWKQVKDLAKEFIGQHTLAEAQHTEKALAEAAQAEDSTAIAKASADRGELKHSSTRGSYTHRIIDAKLVPDKYCVVVKTVNHRLIELAIDEGERQIPGVEIYPKVNVRVASKRKT